MNAQIQVISFSSQGDSDTIKSNSIPFPHELTQLETLPCSLTQQAPRQPSVLKYRFQSSLLRWMFSSKIKTEEQAAYHTVINVKWLNLESRGVGS